MSSALQLQYACNLTTALRAQVAIKFIRTVLRHIVCCYTVLSKDCEIGKAMDSVRTALRIFETVAERGEIGLADLVRELDEPKSTVQRGLTTLYAAQWLRPVDHGARRRWAPSARLVTLMRGQDQLVALRQAALSFLLRLRDDTRETIHLSVRDGDRMTLIDRCDSPQILRTGWPIGASSPLHVAATGKAILATLKERELDAYVERGLVGWTAHSIIDPAQLRRDLAEIRNRGFATSNRELDLGVRAVAAAVRNMRGEAFAALSISCPADRLPKELVEGLGGRVRETAAAISKVIGDDAALVAS